MYDVIILGAGPAGYVAAERAGDFKKKALLVEPERLGGVCLNSGCIPTKAFLNSAKLYDHARHAAAFGVVAKDVTFDYPVAKARTEKVQETLRQGIAGMMKRGKVEVVGGAGKITGKGEVTVTGADGNTTAYQGKNILVATGSTALVPPVPGLRDNPRAVTHQGLLAQPALVDHLCVVGAGVIGLEFATFYLLAGKKVTLIEMLPQIGGQLDLEIAKTLQKRLEDQGATFHLSAKVTKADGSTVTFADKDGKEQTCKADLVLVAAGRAVNVNGIGLETVGVDFDRRGVRVNERAETNVAGLYAAGDVTGRIQLAHFASRQATVAIANMFGEPQVCREEAIPAVIYGDPEIASVGLTEAQAKAKGLQVKTLKLPMAASGRFLAETEGMRAFVKAVVGVERGEILGMHVVGPYASEMIGAAGVMIEAEWRVAEAKEFVFGHPTVSELMHDVLAMG